MTIDEVKSKIIEYLEEAGKPVNPSTIMSKYKWKTEEILAEFDIKKIQDLPSKIPEISCERAEKGTMYFKLKSSTIEKEFEVRENRKNPEENKSDDLRKDLCARIKTILSYLNRNLYGKEEAVRLALLSAIANESIFFMGPPGTAKSMISRRIAAAFKDFYKDGKFTTEDGGYFEYLMNEFSTPDEICGPVDLSALNEKPSRYERQTEGYLPSAKVAFLDEIWKSGPAILNTLLTIINEKKFHNGKKVEKVPLVSLASASNELPEKNRGLEALWDRFILRVFVNPVSNENKFFNVVDDPDNKKTKEEKEIEQKESYSKIEPYLLNFDDVKAWQDEINRVSLSDEAKAVITAIRQELTKLNADEKHKAEDGENYYVSDRRWKKIVHILKTSAFLNGRGAVDLMDCSLIEYAIWNTDKQHNEVSGIVEKILKQNGISKSTAIGDISDQIDEFKDSVDEKWFDEVHNSWVAEKKYEPKLFEPVAKKTMMESFDKEEYTPIVEQIDSEIVTLQNFRADNEKPFSENSFANASRYNPILLNKIDESIKTLEDKKLKLKEQHERYSSDSNVKSDFELCDIILKDGTYKEADEEDDDDDVLAKVCMKGDTKNSAYGIACENFNEYDFAGAKKKAVEYGNDFPEPYNSGWMLPTIEQLRQIYANSHEENDFDLQGKYWSSSVDKEKGGVWYFNFDTGEQECTLPSNKYGIVLIRKLAL